MATHSKLLPGKLLGQRSLASYSHRGGKESGTTERARAHTYIHTHTRTHRIPWPLQKCPVKPFLNLTQIRCLHVKSMSDTILENLSHCPFMGPGLICQNCFRKMLKVENNNSLLTDITVHQISVHTSDDDLHCCTNFDKFQSHRSRVRTGQGLICQANIKQGRMEEAAAAAADVPQEIISIMQQ